MIRFCANLDWLFTEYPLLDRFQAAADCGFTGVEMLRPYAAAVGELARARERAGVEMALINLPASARAGGEFGCAALPGFEADFEQDLARALDYAQALDAKAIHVLAGIAKGQPQAELTATFRANLTRACAAAQAQGLMVCIEPLNSRDRPGYALSLTEDAVGHIAAVNAPNLRLQFDSYHVTIMEGDAVARFNQLRPRIGHIQVSHLDNRGPPAPGAIDFPGLFAAIETAGYDGWVGCEYRPPGPTRDSLGWGAAWGLGDRPD